MQFGLLRHPSCMELLQANLLFVSYTHKDAKQTSPREYNYTIGAFRVRSPCTKCIYHISVLKEFFLICLCECGKHQQCVQSPHHALCSAGAEIVFNFPAEIIATQLQMKNSSPKEQPCNTLTLQEPLACYHLVNRHVWTPDYGTKC